MAVCPECGINLEGLNKEAHGIQHWGVEFKDIHLIKNPDAQERYKQLMEAK